jgi:hypothetical protein
VIELRSSCEQQVFAVHHPQTPKFKNSITRFVQQLIWLGSAISSATQCVQIAQVISPQLKLVVENGVTTCVVIPCAML